MKDDNISGSILLSGQIVNVFLNLIPGDRSAVVRPPACLEAGKTYHIKLSFKKYDKEGDKPTASILVDSVSINILIKHTK